MSDGFYRSSLLSFYSVLNFIFFTGPIIAEESARDLFADLELVYEIDRALNDKLPFYYNYFLMGGYFNVPSSRMASTGNVGLGAGKIASHTLYGVNLQTFDRLELSVNYRNCVISKNNTERIGNIKLALLLPEDGFPDFPAIALGMDDFLGADRYDSPYLVATKQFLEANLEISLGYGWKNREGPFGGLIWSPLRQRDVFFLNRLSFLAEYASAQTHFNWGFAFLGWDRLQLSLSRSKGNEIAGALSFRYPLGTSKGLLPKSNDPKTYRTPLDLEPLGALRTEKALAQELAYGFSDQGLDLYTLFLSYNAERKKVLWMKIVNNRYRNENEVRLRIEHFLSSILPSDIEEVVVVVEADALPVNSYRFRRMDLFRYRMGLIDDFTMESLSPMLEAEELPNSYERVLLFQRKKEIWTFTVRPRVMTFFGSSTGKFKYNLSAIASPEGYLFDAVYYKVQLAYSLASAPVHQSCNEPNSSQLLHVRTDTLRYYRPYQLSLEQGFLQKGWNLGKGLFSRVAAGYFEIAYGGIAAETLYYPINSSWAVGIQGATFLKRRYQGLSFTHKVEKCQGRISEQVHFLGVQYFLDLYYGFSPLKIDFKLSLGQFLAKDKGARIEVGRTFSSGLRFSVWSTFTNGHDRINGHTYYDKGFAFCLPLDLFLKQSSRTFIGNSISAWLRDVGAQAATGKPLFTTISEERYSEGICNCPIWTN